MPMLQVSDPDSLLLLRHRFLIEERDQVLEWLWDEHPQTAAFLLDWLGHLELLGEYLSALPELQQADSLYRLASLSPGRELTPIQQEVLVVTLRNLSPYLKGADADMSSEDPEPLRGIRLVRAYLAKLSDEKLRRLYPRLDEVDPVFSRLCRGMISALKRAGGEPATFHGLLNVYCDLLANHFTATFGERSTVYPDRVEMISTEGLAQDAPSQTISFRLELGKDGTSLLMKVAVQLSTHYLEHVFGGERARFVDRVAKLELTEIEIRVVATFVQMLADYLDLVLELDSGEAGYRVEALSAEEAEQELAKYGKTPLLISQLSARLGEAAAGSIAIIMPPSHLHQLQSLRGEPLFEELLSGALPESIAENALSAIEGGESPGGGEVVTEVSAGEEAADDADTLEDFLWRIEMEEAERLAQAPKQDQPQALDLFLRGYAPEEIAQATEDSPEDNHKLAEIHYFYGARHFQKGFYTEAAEALEQAVAVEESHEGGQLLLAAAWGEQGLYFKEIITYKKLISEGLALPEAHVLLARRLAYLGRIGDAFASLKLATDMDFDPKEIVESDPCFRRLLKSVKWRQFMVDSSKE